MRRNPLYVFDNLDSKGIYNVPLESTVQINDADGNGSTLIVQVSSKDNMDVNTTIRDFLQLEDNYERPGTIGMLTDDAKGQPDGVAPLDENGLIPGRYIPTMDINNAYVVNTVQDMLDISNTSQANIGDVCIVTDTNETYIYNGDHTGTVADWTKLIINIGDVQSVNGKTGVVVLNADDIDEGAINRYMNPTSFKDYFRQEPIQNLSNVIDGPANVGDALTFDGTNWGAAQIPQKVVSVNGFDGVVNLTTSEISENGNLYYTDDRVDSRIQTEWIDPISGIGDYNKIWSADKIATELSYLTTKDYVDNGLELKFDKVGGTITGDVLIDGQLTLSNGDIKIGDSNGISLYPDAAPTTDWEPTEPDSLVRKDYVDGEIASRVAVDPGDSIATDIEQLVSDYNDLLSNLRNAGIIA